MAPDPSQPLAGLVVLELGHSVAAPFAGQVLADLGAEVIKVENPSGGDDARSWGPPFWEGASATFQGLNRNKASVTLDFKDSTAVARFHDLAGRADVVIQNMRPGLVARYGIDATALRAANPRLIYCNLGAYGGGGPLSDKPGYDPLMQAFAGIMSITGEADRPPVRVGPSIIDIGSGLWAVIGILSALMRRRDTGEGGVVDLSLFETALSWMTIPIAGALASGKEPGRTGSETPMLAPYMAYRALDTHVVIAAGNDNLFRRLCEVLGHPAWSDDARFRSNSDRVANRQALNAEIEAVIGRRVAVDWVEALNAAGVPCAPTQGVTEVIGHPQTQALDMISATPDGRMRLVRSPLRFDGVRPPIRSGPPALGADTERLLGSIPGEEA